MMAEGRRAQLTACPCDASSCPNDKKTTLTAKYTPSAAPASVAVPAAEVKGSAFGQSSEPTESTLRFVLTLFESDERTFPEFSYTDLVGEQTDSVVTKDGAPNKSEERDNQDHVELAAIVRRFEKKFGEVKKKKKDRIQDLVDMGYGYDEDSFIDNSEAYDEFVPASLTTTHGGFYVNSGVLQFRQASDSEAEDFTTSGITPSKKRKLNVLDKPKKRRSKGGGKLTLDPISKERALSEEVVEVPEKKKKKTAGALSVTNMLKKFRRQKEREMQKRQADGRQSCGTPGFPICPADAGGGGGTGLADPLLSLIGSTNDHALIQAAATMDFDIDLDSLLDATEDGFQLKMAQHATETHLVMDSPTSPEVQNQSTVLFQPQTELKSVLVPQPTIQPEGLSAKLEGTVGDLKLVEPLEKLKEAIGKVMPEQIARFHDNRQAHAQVKSTKVTEEKTREQRVNVGSEDEGEEKIGRRGPQKKFKWNKEIRECLCLVVKAKMDIYELERSDNQELEEYLKNFLDNEVKTLWPKGWMQPRLLLKESKRILGQSYSLVSQKNTANGTSNPDGSAETLYHYFRSVSCPKEKALSLDTDKKTLKEVLTAKAHLHVSVVKGANEAKGLDSEPPTLSETTENALCDATSVTAASTHSLLDLLAEQALARGQLVNGIISQKLKAAVSSATMGKLSDLKSPPLPSPPPQSSPGGFPGVGVCQLFEATGPQVALLPGQVDYKNVGCGK